MKIVFFVIGLLYVSNLQAQSTLNVDQTEGPIGKKMFSRVDFGASLKTIRDSSTSPTTSFNGLTFHVKSVILPEEEGTFDSDTESAVVAMGEFQIEMDVYGSNRPDGTKAISLNKLGATFFSRVDGLNNSGIMPPAILKLTVVDFLYERLDNNLSTTLIDLVGGEVIIRPMEWSDKAKNSPVKVILSGKSGLGTGQIKLQDLTKANSVLTPNVVRQAFSSFRIFPRRTLGAGLSVMDRIFLDSSFSSNQYRGLEIGSENDDIRVMHFRQKHMLRIPLNIQIKGQDLEVVANYTRDRLRGTREASMVDGVKEATILPYELRSNTSAFVGVNIRFSRE